jgi:signal transduction histidine kinase
MTRGWTLRHLSITRRLRIVFLAVIALVVAGSTLSFWQFRSLGAYATRISATQQRLTTVLRLNNRLLGLTTQLHRIADRQNPVEFETESAKIVRTFESESREAVAALEELAETDQRHAVLARSVVSLVENLPGRVASLAALAHQNDWVPVRARLSNASDQTDEVMGALMTRLDADLADAHRRLTADLANTQKRAVLALLFAAALSLAIAAFLGALVTKSIREPLAALEAGARSLERGDFCHRIAPGGNDELTDLTHAFNRAAKELQRLFTEVQQAHAAAEAAQSSLAERAHELARANADLQQFAYSASHDLQEPLRIISVYSQMLQRKWPGDLDQEANRCLDFLGRAARQMQQLIDDLLTYTRAGQINGKPRTAADPNQVLRRVLELLRVQIDSERGVIRAQPLPPVQAHDMHVQQILQNLISNSIKYHRDNEPPEIGISGERKGPLVEIAIRDNGIGIDPQYADQIFVMFKRLHGHRYEGTGIGLAISKRIVEAYGGTIRVEARPGKGSTFRFTLPAAEPESRAEDARAAG